MLHRTVFHIQRRLRKNGVSVAYTLFNRDKGTERLSLTSKLILSTWKKIEELVKPKTVATTSYENVSQT